MTSPALIVHIAGGTVGLLSGFAAVSVRKGERLHRIAGTAFFVSMLVMAAMGACLAIPLQQWGNVIGGIFTFYLVATAWMTVRRKEGTTGNFEIGAMLVALGGAVAILILGLLVMANPKTVPGGVPAQAYFVLGVSQALLPPSTSR